MGTLKANMRFSTCLAAVLAFALFAGAAPPQHAHPVRRPAPAPVKIDKAAIEKYLRYAEGYTPQVKVEIDDPVPSPFAGLDELLVHLSAGRNQATHVYYLTRDRRQLIPGVVYDLQGSPFEAYLSKLKVDGSPTGGPVGAPVTIYIFSDFECPFCREEAKVIRDNVEKTYPNDVRVIFKNFPIESIHPWARSAAEAGECIAHESPDAFWTFHDWIYEHQSEIAVNNLRDKVLDFAKSNSLDVLQLSGCLDSNSTAPDVDKTIQEGRRLGITQTPTLFVNGRLLPGALQWDQMHTLIQMELDHHQQEVADRKANDEKCCSVDIPAVGKN